MSWWAAITGMVRPVKVLLHVFRPDVEGSARPARREPQAGKAQDTAPLPRLATEVQLRANRTRWDSFVDGLNRLPRPLLTVGVLAFFVLAALDPNRFIVIASVYRLMPDGFWALLGVIVAFYFGGRMQIKSQDGRGAAVTAAGAAVADRQRPVTTAGALETQAGSAATPLPAVDDQTNARRAG